MLKSLSISNYALIDTLNIDFHSGLNIITGETGAGKSIMLGALGLLLGARADSRAVRHTDRRSVVEAVFDVTDFAALRTWAESADIEWFEPDCILRREIQPNGRSRAFINDSPVTLAQLQHAGAMLIDIHSQHQNQLLATADYQREVIDALADNAALLAQYATEYAAKRAAEQRLREAKISLKRDRDDEEFIRFQLDKLTEPQLQAGEQEELEKEREILANMTDIKRNLAYAVELLQEGQEAVIHRLSEAVDATEELSESLEDASALAERLESARVEIQDIAETLEDYNSNLSADPSTLESIEERLNLIYTLQRRFNVDSVEALIELREKFQSQLDLLADSDVAIEELKNDVRRTRKVAAATAAIITERRTAAAAEFSRQLMATARPLAMPNLQCSVEVTPAPELTPSGGDVVEFRCAFNKNQPLTAIGGAASGGEISRLMLSIKSIVAGRLQIPTIVFDEVDTGVSGDVANRMGQMMRSIADAQQVITITHLPQVAALGAVHYKVYKEDDDSATHTRICRLSDAQRRGELALMLSGAATDEAALSAADALLARG
jgi:DNA repair protein RecN (Recombination protein N)